jgi:hypothetical protein
MFKKSSKTKQLDAFTSVSSMLDDISSRQYNETDHWHNQFREQIVMRLDEPVFSVLFDQGTGAPNSSVRVLVGMMTLKEAFGWSDAQLYEHCRFDLLTRSALGLFHINDALPVESTYYLFRKRIYEYQRSRGDDLMEQAFRQITGEQIREFNVNGLSVRMDSKLIGSNIAFTSRYENIHKTICIFFKSLDQAGKSKIGGQDMEQIDSLTGEDPAKIVYRQTKEEIKKRLEPMGVLLFNLLNIFRGMQTDAFRLAERIFQEQYKVTENQQIELRPKEEMSSDCVQSPHDPDSAFRNKRNHPVRGYCVNITETCSDDSLNLITNVMVDKANVSEQDFVEPSIRSTIDTTGQPIEKYYADGAYQSPDFDHFSSTIDMVYTGLQGVEPQFDLELTPSGLIVTETATGEQIKATVVKRKPHQTEEKWRISTPKGYRYFARKDIRNALIRRRLKERPVEDLHKRNNVEATIFQLCHRLRNNKSKYRGIGKQRMWATCRCLWINLIRITNHTKQMGSSPLNTTRAAIIELILTMRSNVTEQFILSLKFCLGSFLDRVVQKEIIIQ